MARRILFIGPRMRRRVVHGIGREVELIGFWVMCDEICR